MDWPLVTSYLAAFQGSVLVCWSNVKKQCLVMHMMNSWMPCRGCHFRGEGWVGGSVGVGQMENRKGFGWLNGEQMGVIFSYKWGIYIYNPSYPFIFGHLYGL